MKNGTRIILILLSIALLIGTFAMVIGATDSDQPDDVEVEVASAKMMVEKLNYIVMVNKLANPGYETPATITETIEAYNRAGITTSNVDPSSTEFPSAPDAIKNVIVATAANLNGKDGSAKLRFYIRADQNYGITLSYTDVSTKVQETVNIDSANLAQNGTDEVEGATCYYYDLPLQILNFNQDITIAVDGISEGYTYNFGSYVKALNASDESAEVKSAVSSLYAYADKSREYVLIKDGEIDPDDGYVPPEWGQQTVIFVVDGMTHHTASVPYGDKVTMPGNPTKEGYTFAGWYTDNGTFENAFTQATPVTDSITVYAKFTRNTYTVTFVADNSAYHSATVSHGSAVQMPSNPSKTGWTFAGWYTDNGTFNNAFNPTAPVTDNATVYAKFTLNSYTVKFMIDNSAYHSATVSHGSTVEMPSDPSKTGWTFAGWYTDNGTFNNAFTKTAPVTDNTTVYAKFTRNSYTVTFLAANGGTHFTTTAPYNQTVANMPGSNPTKEHYAFAGWYTDSAFSNPFYASTTVTGNMTIYPKFTPNNYTVTFVGADGTTAHYTTTTPYNQTVVSMPSTNPTKDGWTFAGWYTDNGTFNNAFTASTIITGKTTVYPKFTQNSYTVKFMVDSTQYHSTTVPHGSKVTMPSNPTKTGWTFNGWYTDSGFTSAFNKDAGITANTTVYAKFTINTYTVTFMVNGSQHSTAQVSHGNAAPLPSVSGTHSGWHTNAALNAAYSGAGITANTTLYLKNIYTVTFKNGSTTVSAPTVYHGGTVQLHGNLSQTGWTFDGWFYNGTKLTSAITNVTSNMTVTAQFTINKYTVTFLNATGGTHTTVNVDYNGTVTSLPGGPTKTGHTFAGWYSNSGLTTSFTTSTKITANTTVYPKFTANKYTVTFLNATGGTHTTVQVEYDKTVTSLPGGPTKTGHTFAGWFSNSGLTTSFTTSTKITANTTVYPKFTANTYTVTFLNATGGTHATKTTTYGGTVSLPGNPTKDGYDFAGWFSNSGLTTAFSASTTVTSNMTIYPKFTQKQSLRILFIGNSLTYYNDMPEIFEALAKAAGKNLTVESVTRGSSTMKEQITSSTSLGKKVAEALKEQWDYVVIQPSRRITNQESTVKKAELAAVVTLNDMIKAAGAQAIIYGTFGNNNSSVGIYTMDADGILATKTGIWSAPFSEHNEYMIGINQEFADKIGAPLVNVASMYKYAVNNYSSVNMFHTDDRHPSLIGSYAIACAFYAHFYNQSPEAAAASYTGGLTADAAKFAAQLAAKNAGLISSITATPDGSSSGNAGESTIIYTPVEPSTNSDGKYLISTPGHFMWIQQQSAAGNSFAGVSFQQTANINLGGGNFIPIGLTTPFKGNYDGKGYTLSNFAVTVEGDGTITNGVAAGAAGIFANIDGSKISGLSIENVTIKGTWAGGVVGYAANGAEVRDCVLDRSSSVEGSARVGGIVGTAVNSKINYCTNLTTVYSILVKDGDIYVGGIVGVIQDTNVAYCFNRGDVSVSSKKSSSNACGGGIIGLDSTGDSAGESVIKYCVNEGVVLFDNGGSTASTRPYLGGIIGRAANGSGTYTVKLQNCYNLGSFVLTVPNHTNYGVGQLCGVFANPDKVTFTNCYGLDTVYTQLSSTYDASVAGGSTGFLAGKEGSKFTAGTNTYDVLALNTGSIGLKTEAEIQTAIDTFVANVTGTIKTWYDAIGRG